MTDDDLAYTTISELAPLIEVAEQSRRWSSPTSPLPASSAMTARSTASSRLWLIAPEPRRKRRNEPSPPAIILARCTASRSRRRTFMRPKAHSRPSAPSLFADWVPDHDAAVVERLRAAGAIILGKTNLQELAYGTTSANPSLRPSLQSLETGLPPRRLQRRIGSSTRRRLHLDGARKRHRRFDPPARRLLRRRRHQADLRARLQTWLPAARLVHGSRRPHDQRRQGRRPDIEPPRWLRPTRPLFGRSAGSRLHGRAWTATSKAEKSPSSESSS